MFLARADMTDDYGWLLHLLIFNLNQGVTDDQVSGGNRNVFNRETSAFILIVPLLLHSSSQNKVRICCNLREVVGIKEIFP